MWLYVVFLLLVGVCGQIEQGTIPSAPRRVIAKAISPHAIQVIWRDPDLSGKDGEKESRHYIVRYKEVNDMANSSDAFNTIRSRQLKVRINKLTPKTTYDIWVKVVRKKKASTWSKANQVTTDDPSEVYLVRNLTATPVASDAVLLSWLPPKRASKVVAYTILTQLVHGKDRQQRKDVANKEMLEYKVGNLQPNSLYSFRVQTMQKRAPHPLSSEIQARPFSDHPSGPPRDLTLVVNGSDYIQVLWQPPAASKLNGQIVGYTLQYKHTGTAEEDIQTITIRDALHHSLTDITDNETYDVRIAARTVNGTGPFTGWKSVFVPQNSDEVRRTYEQDENVPEQGEDVLSRSDGSHLSGQLKLDLVIPPPSDVNVVNKTSSSVFLVWSMNKSPECCPVIAYKIVISNYNDSSEHEIVRGTAHVHLMSLTPHTVYGVMITALSTTGESSPSKETLFTTLEAVPPSIVSLNATRAYLGGDANLTCTCQGHDILQINWYISAGIGVDANEDNIFQITSDSDIAEQVKIVSSIESYDTLTSSVVLHKVRREAAREYICIASNSIGSHKRQLYLPVLEPPRIITSHGISVTTSSVARLACEAYGNPIPDIVWIQSASGAVFDEKHDDGEIHHIHTSSHVHDASQIRQSFLVVRNTSIHDGGIYACVAQSEAGRTESKVVLTVTVPPPGPVHKIQTIPLSPSRVSVSWFPPLNYGYSIAYYQVSYRKKHGGQPQVFNTTRVRAELYDLEHFTEYLIGVIAGTDDSLGESGPEVEVMTLTNDGLQPANVTVKALNTSIIQLDWDAPSSVSHMYIRGYNVYTRREGEDRMEKLFVRGSSSKQFLIGLGRDDTYYLKISTLMTWGHEAHSPWIRIQKPSEVYLPPGKPLNVTAAAKTHGITLSWEPPPVRHPDLQTQSVQIKGYKIVYGPLDNPLNVSRATLEADIRKHFITGLVPSTKYIISIRAFNDIGDGEPVYTRTITQASPPSMVQNAVAQPVSSTEIHVQWEPPRRGQVTQYHIRYWRPGHKDKQSAWLAGNFQNYVAGSLKKRSNYRFEIIPYHGELPGEGIVIFSQTFGDKPDGPPTDVSIRSLNSSALIATWKPPDVEKANGDITGYKLVLRAKGGSRITSFTVPGTARSYVFLMKQNRLHHSLEETVGQDEEAFDYLDIPSSRTYKFRMAAMTVNGTGVYSPWIECALSSPAEKPGPPQNLSVLGTETSLTLQWKSPQFTGSPVHGYIVGYGQFIPEVYKQILSASQTTFTIKSLKPDSEYITSVRAFNHIGESSPTFSIVRTRTTAPLITGLLAPVKLVVQSESPTSLLLSWLDPDLSSTQKKPDGRAYLIRFSPLTGETYSYINTSSLHLELSNLTPATQYEISVKIVRGNSSSSWSLPVVNSTQQIAPSTAPENIVVSPLPRSPSLISLSWSHPASPNGKIEEYIIYLTSDPTLDTKLWLVMRTDKQEVKITDIIPHTTYYFKLQARNRAGYGPLSETVAYNPPTDNRAAPTNLTVTGLYGNMSRTVKVSWSMPEVIVDQITGYMVYYTDEINEDADWLVQTERGLDAVIMGLGYNKTYYFKVQARYSAAYGLFSKTASYTTEPQTTEASPRVNSDGAVNHSNSNKDGSDNSGEYKENVTLEENTHNRDVIVIVSTDINPDNSTVNSSIVNDVNDTVIVHHPNISDYDDADYEDLKFDDDGDGNFSDKDNIYDNSESDNEDYSESLLEGNLSAHPLTNSTSHLASTSEVSTDVNSEKDQNQLGKAESNTTNVAYEYFDTMNSVSNISDLNSSQGFNFNRTSVIETDVNGNSSQEVEKQEKSDQ